MIKHANTKSEILSAIEILRVLKKIQVKLAYIKRCQKIVVKSVSRLWNGK